MRLIRYPDNTEVTPGMILVDVTGKSWQFVKITAVPKEVGYSGGSFDGRILLTDSINADWEPHPFELNTRIES